MDPNAQDLIDRRTTCAADWSARDLAAARDRSVAVVLPALNEEATVGPIVTEIRHHLMRGSTALVDELVVLDSGSVDATGLVARAAGARVVHRDEVLSRIPAVVGKGEAMWRGVAATSADLIVFIDADLRSFSADYVVGLLGPMLADPHVDFVKACYDRPATATAAGSIGGGRVTELVARPLLNLYWPALSGIIQPLAGEYALRRELIERLPFPCGYGVDFALLVDAFELRGPQAFAQVDLGVRRHRHHDDLRLGRMAAEIMGAARSRIGGNAPYNRADAGMTITQFQRVGDVFLGDTHDVAHTERPPLLEIPEYAATHRCAAGLRVS